MGKKDRWEEFPMSKLKNARPVRESLVIDFISVIEPEISPLSSDFASGTSGKFLVPKKMSSV